MGFVDDKGRPELVVSHAIKLGRAFFKPVPSAEPAPEPAQVAEKPKRVRRTTAVTELTATNPAPTQKATPVKRRRKAADPNASGHETAISAKAVRRQDAAAAATEPKQPATKNTSAPKNTAATRSRKQKTGGHP
ncbi:hypothetical protein CPI83_29970 (plasmid) [Rhodococcus sp. H-CA8f]|uniref:hypothetical protein n=1 Tax=Rhodococcus sp. H-CA8f TaxID=1727214 RepID=UPI000BE31DFA|nr:hypothetical protein [Rhodococcus sp. H-CA8f]ATI36428.1 hypothetical protein CPI83_29970 [Rhodococcus sp. H-CA8f]